MHDVSGQLGHPAKRGPIISGGASYAWVCSLPQRQRVIEKDKPSDTPEKNQDERLKQVYEKRVAVLLEPGVEGASSW